MDDDEFHSAHARAVDGDEDAWTLIYDWLAPAVLGYLRAKGAPDPEDAASEVFLQVVRDIDTFTSTAPKFRSWVFTIAHHRMVDQSRRARRRPAEPTETEDLAPHLPTVDWEAAVVEDLATVELTQLFRWATPDQQEVLVLRFVGGLTLREVAEVLGKRLGATKALQRRGLEAVRAAVDEGVYPLVASAALT